MMALIQPLGTWLGGIDRKMGFALVPPAHCFPCRISRYSAVERAALQELLTLYSEFVEALTSSTRTMHLHQDSSVERRHRINFAWVRPGLLILALLAVWEVLALRHRGGLLPGPWGVALGIVDLLQHGLLFKYVVASLFRVTWGFGLAAVLAIPLGMIIGWYSRAELALNPLIQFLRPISPLAWIPIAILWFGVGDSSAIFLIFLGSFFPLILTSMSAVRSVPTIYIHAGRNFGLSPAQLFFRVLYPAILPQIIVGLRITLGVAWLVVVAAEMIAVNSGLGFLIVDARNAGNRYDLVVAGMLLIGLIGLLLDLGLRSLESIGSARWNYAEAG